MSVAQIISRKPDMVLANASAISHRIDPNPFRPVYIDSDIKLDGFPNVTNLGQLLRKGKNGLSGGATPLGANYKKDGIRFIRTGEVNDCWIDASKCVFISREDDNSIKRSRLSAGDVLLTITGACFGKSAVVPKELLPANISQHSVRIRTASELSPYFLVAYLNSSTGQLQIFKQTVGSTRQAIDYIGIREIRVPIPDRRIQDYIGVKVELAERCRAHALKKKCQAFRIFDSDIAWKSEYEEPLGSHWLQPEYLETRLDLNFNSPKKLRLYEYFKDERIETTLLQDVAEISAMIGWKGLTTEHYVEDGPWLLRGVEIRDGYIDFESLVSVQRDKYDEQPQIHLKHGDVVMTKDGTIGKAIVIPEIHNEMAAGSTVARLRPRRKPNINPYYLEFVINHPVLQIQIQSFATGLAQPHITQEWIAKLRIPRTSSERKIADLIASHHSLMTKAQCLVADAKSDIEALIEGILDTNAILSGKLKPPTWETINESLGSGTDE